MCDSQNADGYRNSTENRSEHHLYHHSPDVSTSGQPDSEDQLTNSRDSIDSKESPTHGNFEPYYLKAQDQQQLMVPENPEEPNSVLPTGGEDRDFQFFFPYYFQSSASEVFDPNQKLTDHNYAVGNGASSSESIQPPQFSPEIKVESDVDPVDHQYTNLDINRTGSLITSTMNHYLKSTYVAPTIGATEVTQSNEYFYRDNYANLNNSYIYLANNMAYQNQCYDGTVYSPYSYESHPTAAETDQPLLPSQPYAAYSSYSQSESTGSQPEVSNEQQVQQQQHQSSSLDYNLYSSISYSTKDSDESVQEDSKDSFVITSEDQQHKSSFDQINGSQNVLKASIGGDDNNSHFGGSSVAVDERYSYCMENKENNIPIEEMQRINTKYTHQRFPIKLWNLASDKNFKPINWSSDGMSLIIDEYALEPNLGYFFRSKKFSSFLRQLHLYGFRKVTRARNHRNTNSSVRIGEMKSRSECISEYQCAFFRRDKLELVKNVRRFYGNHSNQSQTTSTSSNGNNQQIMDSNPISPDSSSSSSLISGQPSSSGSPSKLASPMQLENQSLPYEYYQIIPGTSGTAALNTNSNRPTTAASAMYNNSLDYKFYNMNDSCSLMDYHQSTTNYQQSLLTPVSFA